MPIYYTNTELQVSVTSLYFTIYLHSNETKLRKWTIRCFDANSITIPSTKNCIPFPCAISFRPNIIVSAGIMIAYNRLFGCVNSIGTRNFEPSYRCTITRNLAVQADLFIHFQLSATYLGRIHLAAGNKPTQWRYESVDSSCAPGTHLSEIDTSVLWNISS